MIRIYNKKFQDEELHWRIISNNKQTTKKINAFANHLTTDIKLSKAQIPEIIQSGGSFSPWLSNLGKKAETDLVNPLTRDHLPGLVSNLALNLINKFERKISATGAVTIGKGFNFQLKIWMILLIS